MDNPNFTESQTKNNTAFYLWHI